MVGVNGSVTVGHHCSGGVATLHASQGLTWISKAGLIAVSGDTVIVQPGEVVRIAATYGLPGEYVWHCHILSHENNKMMRPYQVLPNLGVVQS